MPEKRPKIDFNWGAGGLRLDAIIEIEKYSRKRNIPFGAARRILEKLIQGGKTNVSDASNPATAEEVSSKHSH